MSTPSSSTSGATPRVSVVLLTYRRPRETERAISRLLAQTLVDFELLVRDDGDGDDGTAEAVQRAASGDARIRYSRNGSHLGRTGSMNAALREARGEYVAICHDHDLVSSSWLASLAHLLDGHPTAWFAHCAFELVDAQDQPTGDSSNLRWGELTEGSAWLRQAMERMGVPVCCLAMVRREAFARFGALDPVYGQHADLELWLRLACHGGVAFTAEPQVTMREPIPDQLPWRYLFTLGHMLRRHVDRAFPFPGRGLERLRWEARATALLLGELRRARRRNQPLRRDDVPEGVRGGFGAPGRLALALGR